LQTITQQIQPIQSQTSQTIQLPQIQQQVIQQPKASVQLGIASISLTPAVSIPSIDLRKISIEALFVESQRRKFSWLIFGEKGEGKTTTALSFPGKILAFSYDGRTSVIKYSMYKNDPRITVVNVSEFLDTASGERAVESALTLFNLIDRAIDYYVQKFGEPDWIVHDYASKLVEICEWAARAIFGIRETEAGAPWKVWRKRNELVQHIHNKSFRVARLGLIYTCYPRVEPKIIYEGSIYRSEPVPKWLDDMIAKMDFVLECIFDRVSKRYKVRVWDSKYPDAIKPGEEYDVTNTTFWNVIKSRKPDVEKILFGEEVIIS